jgi:hypothetical protein
LSSSFQCLLKKAENKRPGSLYPQNCAASPCSTQPPGSGIVLIAMFLQALNPLAVSHGVPVIMMISGENTIIRITANAMRLTVLRTPALFMQPP